MSTKRLLFIQDDPLLGSIYRDRLETAGFSVEMARTSESGLRLLDEIRPDAVVFDPVLPGSSLDDSVKQIRSQSYGQQLPILLLPTAHTPLTTSATRAGATLLERTANPLGSLVQEVAKVFGENAPTMLPFGGSSLEPHWQQATLSAAPGSLVAVRQALHEVMRNSMSGPAWRDLLQKIHTFASQISLLGENPVSHLALAVEVLVYGLEAVPERINPLTLRTLGQSVDFLAVLWEQEAYLQPLNLQDSHIFIIEDEPSARELIAAAMQLVGLNADGLDTPAASLTVLSTQPSDLIFLDINLPEMNGFEVCTRIRMIPMHEQTPIVFLTGMTTFQNRVQSSLSGGNDFVGKPFNLAELGVKALICLFKGRYGLN